MEKILYMLNPVCIPAVVKLLSSLVAVNGGLPLCCATGKLKKEKGMKKKRVMAVFLTAGMLLDLLSPCAYAAPADTQDEAAFFEELEANAEEIVVSYEE